MTPKGRLNVSGSSLTIFRCLYYINIDISIYHKWESKLSFRLPFGVIRSHGFVKKYADTKPDGIFQQPHRMAPDQTTSLHLYQKFSSMKLNFSKGLSFFRRFIGFFYIFIKTFHPWNQIFPMVYNFSNNFVEFFRQFIKFFRHFPTIYWIFFDIFDVVYIIIILYHILGINICIKKIFNPWWVTAVYVVK